MPRFDVFSEDALDIIEEGWRRLLSDNGVEFLDDEAVELFRRAGQRVDGQLVRFDPDWVLETIGRAPKRFELRARNPERSVELAPDTMLFTTVNSAPFVREGDVRREATVDDYERFVKLSQVIPELDTAGYPASDPTDIPIESRHLQLLLRLYTLQDKPMGSAQMTPVGAADSVAMAEIAFGGRAEIEKAPVMLGIANANSPLRFDDRMIGTMKILAAANQLVVVTPFVLMGAMGPVSVPAAIAQNAAEAFAGMALCQLVRDGAPVVMGSFVSHTDMRSGSPGFGGPESWFGLLATGQLARRYGLLWRGGGGGLTSSLVADAQAAYESFNTMMPSFLAGANLQLHVCGWLESGLVASFEKLVIDLEIVRMLREQFTPLEITRESLALDDFAVGREDGHFFGTPFTMEHFRDCFHTPVVSTTDNFDRWTRYGGRDADARAREVWPKLLEQWEAPHLDPDVLAELEAYVARRTRELGD